MVTGNVTFRGSRGRRRGRDRREGKDWLCTDRRIVSVLSILMRPFCVSEITEKLLQSVLDCKAFPFPYFGI